MGRRSFLGTLLREMDKASNRAAADVRRHNRRVEAVHSRALERELVRQERAADRVRVRAERDAEKRQIATERESAIRRKQDQKEQQKQAQLRSWALELEEHQERDAEIDGIANEAPEVEDRDRLYAELGTPREPPERAFVPPRPHRSEDRRAGLCQRSEEEVQRVVVAFRPDVRRLRAGMAVSFVVAVTGASLAAASAATALGIVLTLVGGLAAFAAHHVATSQGRRERAALLEETRARVEADLAGKLDVLEQEDAERTAAELSAARAEHEARRAEERASFEREEASRLAAVDELRQGNLARMSEVLRDALELELPVACTNASQVASPTEVHIELDVPEPSVLPTDDAKRLASGKVSYKAKSDKRLRDQYLRLVAGLALRHAAEAMLHLPTCALVRLKAYRTAVDPSTGALGRRCALEVAYDFPTLAPMTMDGIDPVATLKHFEHRAEGESARQRREP